MTHLKWLMKKYRMNRRSARAILSLASRLLKTSKKHKRYIGGRK